VELRDLRLPRGRGIWLGALAPLLTSIPAIRIRLISVMRLRFGPR
jgi:hypothetical protein